MSHDKQQTSGCHYTCTLTGTGHVYSVRYNLEQVVVSWLLVNREPCEHGLIYKGTGWPWLVLVTCIHINEQGFKDT